MPRTRLIVLCSGPTLRTPFRSRALMKHLVKLLLPVLCCAEVLAAESKIIAPNETLQKLAGDFIFTEGPACDAQGNVFFTDQPNDRILKWSTDGKLSTFMHPCGQSN